jgi:hypothetical protein
MIAFGPLGSLMWGVWRGILDMRLSELSVILFIFVAGLLVERESV